MVKVLLLFSLVSMISCTHKSQAIDPDSPQVAYSKWCTKKVKLQGFEKAETRQAIYRRAPKYPRDAARKNIQGCVFMFFDVDENGKVSNVKVGKEFPEGYGFKESAAIAILKWNYSKGKPTKEIPVRIDFNLDNFMKIRDTDRLKEK